MTPKPGITNDKSTFTKFDSQDEVPLKSNTFFLKSYYHVSFTNFLRKKVYCKFEYILNPSTCYVN